MAISTNRQAHTDEIINSLVHVLTCKLAGNGHVDAVEPVNLYFYFLWAQLLRECIFKQVDQAEHIVTEVNAIIAEIQW